MKPLIQASRSLFTHPGAITACPRGHLAGTRTRHRQKFIPGNEHNRRRRRAGSGSMLVSADSGYLSIGFPTMSAWNVIIKNQFGADGTSDGSFSIKGFIELLHQFETLCEVTIQRASAGQGGHPGPEHPREVNVRRAGQSGPEEGILAPTPGTRFSSPAALRRHRHRGVDGIRCTVGRCLQ